MFMVLLNLLIYTEQNKMYMIVKYKKCNEQSF